MRSRASNLFLICANAVLAVIVFVDPAKAQDPPSDPNPPPDGPVVRLPSPRADAVHAAVYSQFDLNGNGVIDPDEQAAIDAAGLGNVVTGGIPDALLQMFDRDGNGSLDPIELRFLQQYLRNRRRGTGRGSNVQRGPSVPMRPPMIPQKVIMPKQQLAQKKVDPKKDLNGDGKIDADERKIAREAAAKEKKDRAEKAKARAKAKAKKEVEAEDDEANMEAVADGKAPDAEEAQVEADKKSKPKKVLAKAKGKNE